MVKTRAPRMGSLGELEIIRRLVHGLPERADVLVGPGDDCAVVRSADDARFDWLLKSDPVIEGVHFDRTTPGAAVGHKALGRVLSDIAAMGGEPLWALVNLVAPSATPVARVTGIYAGLNKLARRWRLAIVGGDVTRGPRLELHVFGVGRVPRGQALLRSGARPGDHLFVTGTLGGSRQGKHLAFQPRLAEGRWLRNQRWATAMIDLSDGLATDLRHLIRLSGVGAELVLASIPIASALRKSASPRTAPRSAGQALRHALADGEDYELLFTVPPEKSAALIRAWPKAWKTPCARIGAITDCRGVIECVDARGRRTRLKAAGYEHFENAKGYL